MVSKLHKLILLLVLICLSIIITTSLVALHFVHERKKSAYKEFSEKYKNGINDPSKIIKKPSGSSDGATDTDTTETSSSTDANLHEKMTHTTKETNPLHPNDIKLHEQHVAPDSHSDILLADSHLGLALRDIPFECHDTSKYFAPVELGNSGSAIPSNTIADVIGSSSSTSDNSGESASSSSSSFSTKYGGNALPPELRYGAIVPQYELESVYKEFNLDYNQNNLHVETSKENKEKVSSSGEEKSTKDNDSDDHESDENEHVQTPMVMGGMKRRGVEFVKVENPIQNYQGTGKIRQITHANQEQQKQKQQSQSNTKSLFSSLSNSFFGKAFSYFTSSSSSKGRTRSSSRRRSSRTTPSNETRTTTSTTNSIQQKYAKEYSALYHLQKASELGNPYAQNMIANSLASGILPIHNDPSMREYLNITLQVTSDFSGSTSTSFKSKSSKINNDQLSKAILLWHMSAMEGNIESLMTLGYRHYISATSRSNNLQKILVHDDDLKLIEGSGRTSNKNSYDDNFDDASDLFPYKTGEMNPSNPNKNKKKQTPVRHSPTQSHHYGVLGTCESSLVYYEEAVNHIIDELESGPLRGKVTPAVDTHILPEIRQRGSSAALSSNNKPDELDEALKFMEMRALRKHEPDTASAYKLATMYHHGLRGVKQDLRMALKYYEIGAENNSWECAGQAGKFYLYGMGLEDDERDLEKAYRYFTAGMPGGISICETRYMKKQQNMAEDKNDDDEYDGDDDEYEEDYGDWWEKKIYQCDHPSINGMGLLHVFGVPGKVEPNLKTAVRHFELASKMGNMDSMYNLGMLRLGWMNPFYDDLFFNGGTSRNAQRDFNGKRGPSTTGFLEATALFTAAAEMGHLQAKHRLGIIYSHGFKIEGIVTVKPDCKKALSIFKGIATSVGTTVTKRMRAAYKQYMAGDYESSVRNYLAAAETGNIEAQVNAAFLLEEGYCLGMDHLHCMKASVRLWRAAAKMGHEEAYLRVGDFYYYGRLREDIHADDRKSIVAQRDIEFGVSPLPWVRYVLYPEDLIPRARKGAVNLIRRIIEQPKVKSSNTCSIEDIPEKENTCSNRELHTLTQRKKKILSDEQLDHFKIAAKYYRTAAAELQSARANFNLGFMHEWGLGLSQDFYLAKRYYDLAADQAKSSGDGLVANQIALLCMNIHEYLVKQRSTFNERNKESDQGDLPSSDHSKPEETLQPAGDVISMPSTRFGIILYHVLTWDSALILFFTLALSRLFQHRNNRNIHPR